MSSEKAFDFLPTAKLPVAQLAHITMQAPWQPTNLQLQTRFDLMVSSVQHVSLCAEDESWFFLICEQIDCWTYSKPDQS